MSSIYVSLRLLGSWKLELGKLELYRGSQNFLHPRGHLMYHGYVWVQPLQRLQPKQALLSLSLVVSSSALRYASK
jgi:hypothetical protein